MRSSLAAVLIEAQKLPLEELPLFLSELEHVKLAAFVRMVCPASATPPDELLDVDECARRLHCSTEYLYANHGKLSFTRRMGKKLLFSSSALNSYLKKSR